MQAYLFDRTFDTGMTEHQAYHFLISTLKHRFQTYGYQQVRTSTFEQYDLYQSIQGSVERNNMVKVMAQSGEVMVLRPDVTIPITRMTALSNRTDVRLFYILNVFRQYQHPGGLKERLQAGIERFGHNHPETDAEVIALAIHALKDLGFEHFKIEIGHAGFFKELIHHLDLTANESEQLQMLIQSKNLADIRPFLADLNVAEDLMTILETIPLLYGDPQNVIKLAQTLPLTTEMQTKIDALQSLYTFLDIYNATDSIVFDLGLINHMDYYSDVIFQGFAADYGKPVMMGGRYDRLADQFGATLPAIGFAYGVNDLLDALKQKGQDPKREPSVDIALFYDKSEQTTALKSANQLRMSNYSVVTHPYDHYENVPGTYRCTVEFHHTGNQLDYKQTVTNFIGTPELLTLLNNTIGRC